MHETRFGIAAALAAGFSLTGALAGTTHYSAEAPAGRDLDNAPRIVDGVVDLGAYEMPLSAQIQFLPETCKFLSGGAFQVSFTGGTNAAYDVWASVDLRQWTRLGPATDAGPALFGFTDDSATNRPSRFYRAAPRD